MIAAASARFRRAAPLALAIAVAGCATAGPPRAAARIDAELAIHPLGGGAFVITHEPFHASNVLVVRMPDGTVVICSSPFESQGTQSLVSWVRATMHPARIVAIATHFHLDGSGGDDAYAALGVETWSSTLTQVLLRERGAKMRAGAATGIDDPARRRRVEGVRIVSAAHTFDERAGLTFIFGGEEVRAIWPGAAHSPDNLAVWFPSRKLLFGGCMIKSSRFAGYLGDADLGHWEAAVDQLRPLGAKVVIPGHGAIGGPELYDLTAEVVRAARRP